MKLDDGAGFEILCDGHQFVSLMTVDVTGDNTLVYMTRTQTERLIKELRTAMSHLPARKTRKR